MFHDAHRLDPKPPESEGSPECNLVWYKFSAFTHTPAQALQYFRFVSGNLEIPPELQPLIFSRNILPETYETLDQLTPDLMNSIDLFVTEVGTLRELSVDNFHVNISYTETNLIRAGGKPLLNWWRSLSQSETGPEHEAIIEKTVDALPSKDIPKSKEIVNIIEQARSRTLSRHELSDSLIELKQAFGKPMAIVPAFNVPQKSRQDRVELIDALYHLSKTVGFHFYDPTLVVAEAELEKAIVGGVDVNHYQPGFHYNLLNAVVPFLQKAFDEHSTSGSYKSTKYEFPEPDVSEVTLKVA